MLSVGIPQGYCLPFSSYSSYPLPFSPECYLLTNLHVIHQPTSHLPILYQSPTYPLSIIYHLSIIYLSITYRSSISTGSASLEDHDQCRTLSPRTGRRGGDSERRPRRTHGAALCGSAQVWQGRELRESSAKAQRTLAPRQPLCHQS